MPEREERPAFTGLIVYRNFEHRYSVLYPEGWHQLELATEEGGQGIIFAPPPGDAATSFSVEARDLGTTVGEEDLPTLRAGFLAGLRRMPKSRIESQEEDAIGRLISLEARQTYREGDTPRKRWVRLLYQGSTQARLIAQGATAEEFDYWLPMFNQMMRTFRFGDWWAELTGQEWLPSLKTLEEEEDAGDVGDAAARAPTPRAE